MARSNGVCHHVWWFVLDSWAPHGGRRKLTLKSCPMTSILSTQKAEAGESLQVWSHVGLYNRTLIKKKIKMEFPAVETSPLQVESYGLGTALMWHCQLWADTWSNCDAGEGGGTGLRSSGGSYGRPLVLEEEGETRGDTNTWLCLLLCEVLYWLGVCQI